MRTRLVEEEKGCILGHSPGDKGSLALSAAELAELPVSKAADPKLVHDAFEKTDFGRRKRRQSSLVGVPGHGDDLPDRVVKKEVEELGNECDRSGDFPSFHPEKVFAGDPDFARSFP